MIEQQQNPIEQPKAPELNAICELQQSFQQFIMNITEQARNLQRNAMPGYLSDYNHQKYQQLQKQRQAVEMIKPPFNDQQQQKLIQDAADRVSDSYVKLLNQINNLPDLKESEEALRLQLHNKQSQNRESLKLNNMAKQKACKIFNSSNCVIGFLYSNLEAAKQQILNPPTIEFHQQGIEYEQNMFRRNSSSGQYNVYNSGYQNDDNINM